MQTGNIDARLVYATETKISDKIKLLVTAPSDSYSAIIYPVAVLKHSKNDVVPQQFVQFFVSNSA